MILQYETDLEMNETLQQDYLDVLNMKIKYAPKNEKESVLYSLL